MEPNNATTISELTRLAMEPKECETGSTPFVVVPKDATVQQLEHLLGNPLRKRGALDFNDLTSFATYVQDHREDGTLLLFNPLNETFTAIFDHHVKGSSGNAGWGEHRAQFKPELSIQWKTWREIQGREWTQTELADFIEDHAEDITDPKGATLLEVVKTLQATRNVEYSSGISTRNGNVILAYEDKTRVTGGTGTLELPEQFTIGIPVHVNGVPYKIDIDLRVRVEERTAEFTTRMRRVSELLEHVTNELCKQVATATNLNVLRGVKTK